LTRARFAIPVLAVLLFSTVSPLVFASVGSVSFGPQQIVTAPPGGNGHGSGGGHHTSFTCPTISGADSSVCSTNWSGYADSNSGVSAVSGAWVVPAVSCPSSGSTYVAVWVGIDGYSSSTVEQTGTLAECSNGVASYSAWIEFYPNPMVTVPLNVAPGDAVQASVTSSGSAFTASITVASHQYSTTQTVSGAAKSSAEWVVERPALCMAFHCTLATLADFTSATFTSASAKVGTTTGSISTFSSVAITMVGGSSGPILAEPGSLSSGGSSFTVTYG
jgi:Peptidase A4 family